MVHRYAETHPVERIVGNVYSALSPGQLPADRDGFARGLAAALPPGPYEEDVRVSMLVGVIRAAAAPPPD